MEVLLEFQRKCTYNNPVATIITTITLSMETLPTNAIDCNEEMRITAITSSTIKIPNTRIDDFFDSSCICKYFTMIAVLLIDNAAAQNKESMKFKPKNRQQKYCT